MLPYSRARGSKVKQNNLKNMPINLTLEPATEDLHTLTNNINDEAAIRGMTAKAYAFAFFARELDGQIIGGVNGSIVMGLSIPINCG